MRRALAYAFRNWVNRHPAVVRCWFGFWRRHPKMFAFSPAITRHGDVMAALQRPQCLTNTPHRDNLVAGDFIIGMPPGKRYEEDAHLYRKMLPSQVTIYLACRREAQRRATACGERLSRGERIDLIEDYLARVVFAGLSKGMHGAGDAIVGRGLAATAAAARSARGGPGGAFSAHDATAHNDAALLDFMMDIRHVSARLVVGGASPPRVEARALAAARSLQARVARGRDEINPEVRLLAASFGADRRALTGMTWVSHPVTVQSGALVLRELMQRPEVWRDLRARVQALGTKAWTDRPLRSHVRRTILEAMRHRPVFAIVPRRTARATEVQVGPDPSRGGCPHVGAGRKVAVVTQAALFDPEVVHHPKTFRPERHGDDERETSASGLALMFGGGPRACPARELALEALTQAFIGLAQLPDFDFARWPSRWRWAEYDGPMIQHVPLEAR